uniref:Reverse transcriptase domain-containing protein n=1 Tax=Tanacetum cinerariifolium TaxID=118510 RepID=A0A699HJQ9_TANCI|nr:hypothetical protein [Tanacetum cinerariifolium]
MWSYMSLLPRRSWAIQNDGGAVPTDDEWMGGSIAPVNIQATDFGLKNHMIQQVQNNWLTLRHCDTINVATEGTFMKRRPEECYDLNKNMTAHHNDWDTSAHKCESSSSSTSSSRIAALTQQIEVERDLKTITDQVLPESTTRVPPSVVQPSVISRSFELPSSATSTSSELPKCNPHQPLIHYPSRLNKENLQDKSDIQVHKFLQMFKKLYFNISLVDALALMPNGPPKKLPAKLGDLGKFLIPCDFPELEKCMGLANFGANINLMPFSVWKKLIHHELIPTRMTLELANRSISYPTDIDEDVCVQVEQEKWLIFLQLDMYIQQLIKPKDLYKKRPYLQKL